MHSQPMDRIIYSTNNSKQRITCDLPAYRTLRLFLLSICLVLTACDSSLPALPSPTAPRPATVTERPTPNKPAIPTATREAPPTITRTATPVPASPTPTPTPGLAIDLALVGGTLIDGSGAPPLTGIIVALQGDRIVAVGRVADVPLPPGTRIYNLRGQTIMPGFINAHVHTDALGDADLRAWPRVGITTLRDLGGPRAALLARRRAFASANDPSLPRLQVAGPIITVPGGHPIPVYGLSDEVLVVQGVEDAQAQVTALLDAGADVIKIAVSGRRDVQWPELSNDEIAAISATAHARGVRVSAHVDRAAALRRAVEHGIDDAAHMPRDYMPDDLIALMVERQVVLVPTIDVYEALAEERGNGAAWRQTTLPIMQDNLRRFVAAGGTLALGDDYGNPGMALGMPLAEIQHWQDAGLTPMQIIVAATHGGAQVCGLADQVGIIRPGMLADILVVDGDPLTDIMALSRPTLIVQRGTVLVAP